MADSHAPVPKTFRLDEIEPAVTKLKRRLNDLAQLKSTRANFNDARVEVAKNAVRADVLEIFGADSPEYRDNAGLELRMMFFTNSPTTSISEVSRRC